MLSKKSIDVFTHITKNFKGYSYSPIYVRQISQNTPSDEAISNEVKEFSRLELYPKFALAGKKRMKREKRPSGAHPPRSASMSVDQDWPSVWPAARTFHPASVPLPVRMGYPAANKPSPDKWANTELMKIPNFLHLTPPAVQRHCAAIRKFCSPWPEGVSYPSAVTATTRNPDATVKRFQNKKVVTVQDPSLPEPEGEFGYFGSTRATDASEKNRDKKPEYVNSPPAEEVADDPGYFPMMTTRSSYLYSGPSIRDPRARVASIKVRLEDLFLDDHSQDKLLRLVGDRYDATSNTVTITADRCPLHSQNMDYCLYLLTVIRAEAESVEPWEHEQERQDLAHFEYSGSNSEAAVEALRMRRADAGEAEPEAQHVEQYREAVTTLLEQDENEASVLQYGDSVLALLGVGERRHDARSSHNKPLLDAADVDLPPIQSDTYFERRRVSWITHAYKQRRDQIL